MKTRYLAILATLVFLGFSVPAAADPCRVFDAAHKHCKTDPPTDPPPEPGGDGEYTAALTSGGFIFVDAAVVTPNSQGNSYYSDVSLILSNDADPPESNIAWGDVFAGCAELLSNVTDANTFTVKGENWHINGGAGNEIRIRFKDVNFETRGVDIDFDLIGDKFIDDSGIPVPVLPECGKPSVFNLDEFSIFGQAKKGLKAPSCNVQGPLQAYSVLEIERTDCS